MHNNLENYGWDAFFENNFKKVSQHDSLKCGRVTAIHGFIYHLVTENGELTAELSGKLLYGTRPELMPGVGDWVCFSDYESMGYIVEVLPRKNALMRKSPGTTSDRQLLASNIDSALLVQGLDRDFNLMRLDRYIVQVTSCDIQPVIILNKCDLIDDFDFYVNEINRLSRKCPLYFTSTVTGHGLQEVRDRILLPDKTYIMLGSSGAGKSSMINILIEGPVRNTGSISESTGKGRHVTTSRDLFLLNNGSLLIDTPGMREFGVAMAEDDTNSPGLFPAIDEFADKCRYSDCSHINEEECAVKKAVEEGQLDPILYNSYVKLMKEQAHYTITAEEKKRMGKRFGKMVREVKRFKDLNK